MAEEAAGKKDLSLGAQFLRTPACLLKTKLVINATLKTLNP